MRDRKVRGATISLDEVARNDRSIVDDSPRIVTPARTS
jgi:hypothetical protein